MMRSDSSYGTVAILLHWLTAVLVLVLVVTGFRSGFSADPATKVAVLRVHLPVAVAVLLLTLGRLIWWWRFDTKPAPLDSTPGWQEAIATWTHRLLYVLLIGLLASGVAMSAMSGLPAALFGDAPFPVLTDFAPRAGHGIAARLMVAVIGLHAIGALYHHYVLKDRTLQRMWFQKS